MSDKSPRQKQSKKSGQTIKEKRAAKRAKSDDIPPPILPVRRKG
ncbi:MAG: hypothetical protein NVSMB48_25980 [Marmoricola sp.]